MTDSNVVRHYMAWKYLGQDVIVVELDTHLCLMRDKKVLKKITCLARKYDITFSLAKRYDIDYIPVSSLRPNVNPRDVLAKFQAPELAMYIKADFVHVTDEENIKSIA